MNPCTEASADTVPAEESTERGCGCGPGIDVEMKNAVAIQRNAAAIAALLKAFQQLQAAMAELEQRVAALEDSSL